MAHQNLLSEYEEQVHPVTPAVSKEIIKDFGIQDSNRLTQCILSASYFLFYGYYILQHKIYVGNDAGLLQRMNYFTSLLSFIFALMLTDNDTIYKAIPSVWTAVTTIPGLEECLSLFFAIVWMIASIIWFINYPIAPLDLTSLNQICTLNLPMVLTSLSFLNWASWTFSFMY